MTPKKKIKDPSPRKSRPKKKIKDPIPRISHSSVYDFHAETSDEGLNVSYLTSSKQSRRNSSLQPNESDLQTKSCRVTRNNLRLKKRPLQSQEIKTDNEIDNEPPASSSDSVVVMRHVSSTDNLSSDHEPQTENTDKQCSELKIPNDKLDNSQCPICNKTFSLSEQTQEREAHVNSCLDNAHPIPKTEIRNDTSSDEILAQSLQYLYQGLENDMNTCSFCYKNMSKYSTDQKQAHINRCADRETNQNSRTLRQRRGCTKRIEPKQLCPMCKKPQPKAAEKYVKHLKSCSKKYNVAPQTLISLLSANGISLSCDDSDCKKESNGRRRIPPNKNDHLISNIIKPENHPKFRKSYDESESKQEDQNVPSIATLKESTLGRDAIATNDVDGHKPAENPRSSSTLVKNMNSKLWNITAYTKDTCMKNFYVANLHPDLLSTGSILKDKSNVQMKDEKNESFTCTQLEKLDILLCLKREENLEEKTHQKKEDGEDEITGIRRSSIHTLLSDLNAMLQASLHSDFVFHCKDDVHLKCHKLIICSRCKKLKEVIEGGHDFVDVSNFSPSSIGCLLKYFYTGSIEISSDIVTEVFHLSRKFDIEILKTVSLSLDSSLCDLKNESTSRDMATLATSFWKKDESFIEPKTNSDENETQQIPFENQDDSCFSDDELTQMQEIFRSQVQLNKSVNYNDDQMDIENTFDHGDDDIQKKISQGKVSTPLPNSASEKKTNSTENNIRDVVHETDNISAICSPESKKNSSLDDVTCGFDVSKIKSTQELTRRSSSDKFSCHPAIRARFQTPSATPFPFSCKTPVLFPDTNNTIENQSVIGEDTLLSNHISDRQGTCSVENNTDVPYSQTVDFTCDEPDCTIVENASSLRQSFSYSCNNTIKESIETSSPCTLSENRTVSKRSLPVRTSEQNLITLFDEPDNDLHNTKEGEPVILVVESEQDESGSNKETASSDKYVNNPTTISGDDISSSCETKETDLLFKKHKRPRRHRRRQKSRDMSSRQSQKYVSSSDSFSDNENENCFSNKFDDFFRTPNRNIHASPYKKKLKKSPLAPVINKTPKSMWLSTADNTSPSKKSPHTPKSFKKRKKTRTGKMREALKKFSCEVTSDSSSECLLNERFANEAEVHEKKQSHSENCTIECKRGQDDVVLYDKVNADIGDKVLDNENCLDDRDVSYNRDVAQSLNASKTLHDSPCVVAEQNRGLDDGDLLENRDFLESSKMLNCSPSMNVDQNHDEDDFNTFSFGDGGYNSIMEIANPTEPFERRISDQTSIASICDQTSIANDKGTCCRPPETLTKPTTYELTTEILNDESFFNNVHSSPVDPITGWEMNDHQNNPKNIAHREEISQSAQIDLVQVETSTPIHPKRRDIEISDIGSFITPSNVVGAKQTVNEQALTSFGPGCNIHPETNEVITPMPDYSSFPTPHLKTEIKKFGLRELSKKNMVAKMKEVYKYQHEFVNWEEKTKEKPKKTVRKKNEKEQPQQDETEGSYTTVKEKLIQLIKSDEELHVKVLSFKPLQLTELQTILKDKSLKCSKKDLEMFLDDQCICYFTDEPQKPQRRSRKRQAKK